MKNIKIRILLGGVVLLVLANFFVWQEVWGLGGGLEVIFFDVGQGDAILIKTPEGHQILIDGGPNGGVILEKLAKEMPFWDNTIDLIILTHPDYDHQKGFLDVLDRYKVANILWTGVLRETNTFAKWQEKIQAEKANIIIAQKGQQIIAGNSRFYVLHPFQSIEGQMMAKGSNESSIVLKMVYGINSFLFLGDISRKQEEALLVRSDLLVDIEAEVLKIAHHGSKFSTSQQFLEIVSPEFAVISVSKNNNYGHPTRQVLNILAEFAIKVLRTDELGDIKVVASGSSFIVNY